MKADYKNWVPKGMVVGLCIGFIVAAILLGLSIARLSTGTIKNLLCIILAILALGLLIATVWLYSMYRTFSYQGKRKLSKSIVEGIAQYVVIPEGGIGLDVGCGSGALTIACAKRNAKATMTGIDRWGKEYASFNKRLCENNAQAEGVSNIKFLQGNAVKLNFPDETFDAVTSNYVYHNITGANKQDCLRETLRVLRKGGVFVIHDLMSKGRYGDMEEFVKELYREGYESVKLIDTTDGLFVNKKEAMFLGLRGSTLLVGRK